MPISRFFEFIGHFMRFCLIGETVLIIFFCFGIGYKIGYLAPGYDADVVFYDPEVGYMISYQTSLQEWIRIHSKDLNKKEKQTPSSYAAKKSSKLENISEKKSKVNL